MYIKAFTRSKFLMCNTAFLHLNINYLYKEMAYYAVARGRMIGIFLEWHLCESSVRGFKRALYKKFDTRELAKEFLRENGVNVNAICNEPDSSSSESNSPNSKKESWPDEELCSSGDDDFLLAALDEVEGISGNSENLQLPQKREIEEKKDLGQMKLPVLDKAEGIPGTSKNLQLPKKREIEGKSSCSTSTYKKLKVNQIIIQPVDIKKYGEYDFPIDGDGFVICYTDGSCENNGQKNAVAGFGVYFSESHPMNTAKPVTGRATNNVGEIQAAICAINIAKDHGIPKLCICTDSLFLINSITNWIHGWKKNNWRLKSNLPVTNIDDFKELDKLVSNSNIIITWHHVRGHSGILGNEKADTLARAGAHMYRDLHNI